MIGQPLFGGGRDRNALRTSMLGAPLGPPARPIVTPPPGGIGVLGPMEPGPILAPPRPIVTPPPGGLGTLPGPTPPRPVVGLPPIGGPQRPTPIAPIGPPQRPTPGMGAPILYHPSGAVWDYAMGDAAAGMRAGFLPRGGLLQQILLSGGQR